MKPKSSGASNAERWLADVEAVFGALSHASRRHILLVLHVRGGEMTAGEIADRFACSWPTTTRHLRVLEEAKIISVRREGRNCVYRLDRQHLQQVLGGWIGLLDLPTSTQTWRSPHSQSHRKWSST